MKVTVVPIVIIVVCKIKKRVIQGLEDFGIR